MIRSWLELKAKPAARAELLAQLDGLEVIAAVQDQQGFLGMSLLVALDDPDVVVVEAAWSSHELFERWLDDPTRDKLLAQLRDLLAGEPELRLFRLVDTIS